MFAVQLLQFLMVRFAARGHETHLFRDASPTLAVSQQLLDTAVLEHHVVKLHQI